MLACRLASTLNKPFLPHVINAIAFFRGTNAVFPYSHSVKIVASNILRYKVLTFSLVPFFSLGGFKFRYWIIGVSTQ